MSGSLLIESLVGIFLNKAMNKAIELTRSEFVDGNGGILASTIVAFSVNAYGNPYLGEPFGIIGLLVDEFSCHAISIIIDTFLGIFDEEFD